MSIRSTLLAAAFTLTTLATAQANGLRPIEGRSINLGDMSGVALFPISAELLPRIEEAAAVRDIGD